MPGLKGQDFLVLFLSIAIILAVARAFGEIARKLNQPIVLGELLAGIVLGHILVGDLPFATAIFDRFLHHAEFITITGKSYWRRHRGTKESTQPEDREPPTIPDAESRQT